MDSHDGRIRPHADNPRRWEYRGTPVLLLGGSVEDNLFQIPDLEAHLRELIAAGGNYIRNTMSSRDPGNLWPFLQDETGTYDLDRWDDEYWSRFERCLSLCEELEIIVQVELWDRFDYFGDNWQKNPWNPMNNLTYTADESGLPEVFEPSSKEYAEEEGAFFHTVPKIRNNTIVLSYQKRFVEKVLAHAFRHGNVLYCICNETRRTDTRWSYYWAEFVRTKAVEAGVAVELTEMPWQPRLDHVQHRMVYERPDLFTYSDISQMSATNGSRHWENIRSYRRIVEARRIWPLDCVKTYGSAERAGSMMGSDQDAVEKCWRSILGGVAAFRFHRPPSGLGLSERAKRCISGVREIERTVSLARLHFADDLVESVDATPVYAATNDESMLLAYLPQGGSFRITDGVDPPDRASVRWFDIDAAVWHGLEDSSGASERTFTAPGVGNRLALVPIDTRDVNSAGASEVDAGSTM